jgi:hypothetical protein
MRRVGIWVTLLLVLGFAAGCGQKPGTAPTVKVTGTVTHNGTPVEGAGVTFFPESGRPASGVTDAAGKFTLSTFESGDGAVVGNHKVAIADSKVSEETAPMPGTPEAENYTPPESRFPEKYANPATSELTAEVKDGGENDFTFDITD